MTNNSHRWCGDDCMSVMYNLRPQLCDVCLITDDGNQILGHRIVLASALNYFNAMFAGASSGQYIESDTHEILIKNIDGASLQQVVKWCYTGSVDVNEDNVQQLLTGAKMLDCQDVVDVCVDFIKSQLHPENALGIHTFAEMLGCFSLASYTQQYIFNNFILISDHSEEFTQLTCEKLIDIVSSDFIDTGEFGEKSVLAAIMTWINADPESRRQFLPILIQHVRFPKLSQDILVRIEDEFPLLKNDTICKDMLIEAMKYHLCKGFGFPLANTRFRLRTPRGRPKCLLVVGGQAPKAIKQCEYYDFSREEWCNFPSELPTRRCRAGLAVLDGQIYAIGGFNGSLRVRTVDCFDSQLNQWKCCQSMEARRSTLGVAVLNNLIYAVGGFDGSSGLHTAEVFDPVTEKWHFIASMSTKRSSVGVAALNGLLYAVGGYDGASRQCLASVEFYNPLTNTWTLVSDMSQRRSGAGVGVLNERLYAIGGHDGPAVRKSVECYDPEIDSWSQCADMIIARRNAGVVSKDGLLFVIGGDDGQSNLASIEIYDPKVNSWTLLPQQMIIGRSYTGVAIVDKSWSDFNKEQ